MDRSLPRFLATLACACALAVPARAEPARPFPLPPGHAAASVDATLQRRVHLDLPAPRAERFYRRHFAGTVDVELSGGGTDALVVRTRRPDDGWRRAVLTGQGERTLVTLTPHHRLEAGVVEGSPPPWVHIVIPRSTETRAVLEQDHLVRPRPHAP